MSHKVFICHSSKDKHIADAACAALESHRIPCWIAPRDIAPSAEWAGAIVDAITECQVVLLIFSQHANDSPDVRREINLSISEQKDLVPFRIQNVLPTGAIKYAVSNRHWLDAVDPPMEQRLLELADKIARLLNLSAKSEPLWTAAAREVGLPPKQAVIQTGRAVAVQAPPVLAQPAKTIVPTATDNEDSSHDAALTTALLGVLIIFHGLLGFGLAWLLPVLYTLPVDLLRNWGPLVVGFLMLWFFWVIPWTAHKIFSSIDIHMEEERISQNASLWIACAAFLLGFLIFNLNAKEPASFFLAIEFVVLNLIGGLVADFD